MKCAMGTRMSWQPEMVEIYHQEKHHEGEDVQPSRRSNKIGMIIMVLLLPLAGACSEQSSKNLASQKAVQKARGAGSPYSQPEPSQVVEDAVKPQAHVPIFTTLDIVGTVEKTQTGLVIRTDGTQYIVSPRYVSQDLIALVGRTVRVTAALEEESVTVADSPVIDVIEVIEWN